MDNYNQARLLAIEYFQRAIIAHENEDWLAIWDGYEKFENLLQNGETEHSNLLGITLGFWCTWADCAETDWRLCWSMQEQDWPRLAKILLNDLKLNQEVSNEELLSLFGNHQPTKTVVISKMGVLKGFILIFSLMLLVLESIKLFQYETETNYSDIIAQMECGALQFLSDRLSFRRCEIETHTGFKHSVYNLNNRFQIGDQIIVKKHEKYVSGETRFTIEKNSESNDS